MKKLKLDDLQVESFTTLEVASAGGTVRANAETEFDVCSDTPPRNCVLSDDDLTCVPSCYGTCFQPSCRLTYCGPPCGVGGGTEMTVCDCMV